MTIDIEFVFSNGSCWCGSTSCHLLVRDGEIVIDESDGDCEWQRGRASDHRAYGQYFRGVERLKRWSKSRFFGHLPEEVVRDYVLALVFLGDTRGRKSPSFWRLCTLEWDDGKGRLAPATKMLYEGYAHAVSIIEHHAVSITK